MELRTIQDALNAEPGVYIVHEPTQLAVITITRDGWRTAIERQELGTSIRLHQLVGRFAAEDVLAATRAPKTGITIGPLSGEQQRPPEDLWPADLLAAPQELAAAHITAALDGVEEPAGELSSNHGAPSSALVDAPPSATYICADCGKTFSKAQGLQVHRARKHSTRASVPDAPGVLLEDGTEDLDIVALDDEPNPTQPQSSVGLLGANGHAATVAAS